MPHDDTQPSEAQPSTSQTRAATEPGAAAAKKSTARPIYPTVLGIIAVVLWGLDQGSKELIQNALKDGGQINIIGDFFRFILLYNPGAAFSMGVNYTWVLTGVASAVIIGIILVSRRLGSWLWTIGLALILGGAMGNLTDRFFRAPGPGIGHVVDFVSIGNFAVFNVADSAICCGAALLVFTSFRGVGLDGRTDADKTNAAEETPADA